MDIHVQEPKTLFEYMLTVPSAEGTHSHDKSNITQYSSRYIDCLICVELNTARTVSLKHRCTVLLATIRVKAAIIVCDQLNECSRVIIEKCLTDSLTRFKQVFDGVQWSSSGLPGPKIFHVFERLEIAVHGPDNRLGLPGRGQRESLHPLGWARNHSTVCLMASSRGVALNPKAASNFE